MNISFYLHKIILVRPKMILLIILIGIIIITLIFFVYIKLKYRFWSIQPINHSYNILYGLSNKLRVINEELPEINRYVNIVNIKTKTIEKFTDSEKQKITNFIKNYHLQTEIFNYNPQIDNIFPYLDFSNHKGFISIYYRPTYIIDKDVVKNDSEYMGLLTARVLYINFNNKRMLPVYYTDHLSIKPEYMEREMVKKNDLVPKLLQTHIYHTRHANNKIKVGLLKYYNKPPIIRSLTTINISGFQISTLASPNIPHAKFNLIEISQTHSVLLNDFLIEQQQKYSCVIMPQLSNISALAKSQNIFMYGIILDNKLIALYIFKNTLTYYETNETLEEGITKDPNTILCVASMVDETYSAVLIWGFLMAVNNCSRSLKASFIFIETTSKNKQIIDELNKKSRPVFQQRADFILYNYISPTYPQESCLFIY
jgi:hypothetical protein